MFSTPHIDVVLSFLLNALPPAHSEEVNISKAIDVMRDTAHELNGSCLVGKGACWGVKMAEMYINIHFQEYSNVNVMVKWQNG